MNKQSSALLNTAEIEENPQSGYVYSVTVE